MSRLMCLTAYSPLSKRLQPIPGSYRHAVPLLSTLLQGSFANAENDGVEPAYGEY